MKIVYDLPSSSHAVIFAERVFASIPEIEERLSVAIEPLRLESVESIEESAFDSESA